MSPSFWTSKTFRLTILTSCSFRAIDAIWQSTKFIFVKETELYLIQTTSKHTKINTPSLFFSLLSPNYSILNIAPFIYLVSPL